MRERPQPPADISPEAFFTQWVPEAVASDEDRRRRLGDTDACICFELTGEGGGTFTIEIDRAGVQGRVGPVPDPNLRVFVDVATWRQLNAGEISAPEALLKRRIRMEGNFLLAIKLHLILG